MQREINIHWCLLNTAFKKRRLFLDFLYQRDEWIKSSSRTGIMTWASLYFPQHFTQHQVNKKRCPRSQSKRMTKYGSVWQDLWLFTVSSLGPVLMIFKRNQIPSDGCHVPTHQIAHTRRPANLGFVQLPLQEEETAPMLLPPTPTKNQELLTARHSNVWLRWGHWTPVSCNFSH